MLEHFKRMISFSPVSETGFCFAGATSYLDSMEINIDPKLFWDVMFIFLEEKNNSFREMISKKMKNKK